MKRVLLLLFVFLLNCSTASSNEESVNTSQLALSYCATPSQLASDLGSASQDNVISLSGVNPLDCPEVSMSETWSGGKLVFSDSPEHPSVRGKLYEDSTLGATGTDNNRVFLYHTNGKSKGKMKFTVLVKNLGASTATLTVQKVGTAGPTTSYLYAGKLGFQRWLDSTAGSGVNVSPGSTVTLDSTFDALTANPNYLLHGIWDYSMTQPHQVTICALNQNDNPLTVCPGLSVLSRDSHQRGTFPYADKVYDLSTSVDTVDGIQQFPLASGAPNDSWAVGTDVTDSSSQTLTGNYGVLYRMHFSLASSDSKNFGFLLNPRGGQWGGAVWAAPGLEAGGKFLLPAGSGSTGLNTNGVVEGKYDPSSTSAPWAQFMPTGGSALPLRFVMVPH